LQRAAMPELEAGYREITGLPSSRSDITLFRLLPETTELSGDRPTLRLLPDGLDSRAAPPIRRATTRRSDIPAASGEGPA
jgi:hypothetical protein